MNTDPGDQWFRPCSCWGGRPPNGIECARLALPRGNAIAGFANLNDRTKVGVQVGSVAGTMLSQRHVQTSSFGFEEDILEALAAGEIDAAAVTPLAAGYYNLTHPSQGFVVLPPDERQGALVGNAAVGLRKPYDQLVGAVDEALDRLRSNRMIETIYAKYGIASPPH